MGKPVGAARAEAAKCAWACRYYAENGERLLADEPVDAAPGRSFIRYQPIGPVLAVMPWNFPFWQVFRFAAPALMAGNVGLLKHASNVPQCALEIEDIFRRAGFPEGAFQTLLIGSAQVARGDRRPARGGRHADRQRAGRRDRWPARPGRRIKKTVLELGGSDPFMVMPSADLERAVRTAVEARIVNNGQSCIAAKRFIVHERDRRRVRAPFRGGDGSAAGGRPDGRENRSGAAGHAGDPGGTRRAGAAHGGKWAARVLTGGQRLDGPGNFYAPTVLADMPEGIACLARRVVRAGGRAVPRGEHRRSDPPRQRHRVRPGRQRVDQRRRGAAPLHRRDWKPAWCSSTAWWPPTRACRSAA